MLRIFWDNGFKENKFIKVFKIIILNVNVENRLLKLN